MKLECIAIIIIVACFAFYLGWLFGLTAVDCGALKDVFTYN